MSSPGHIPVLLEETVAPLARAPGNVFVDGTVGGGGHLARLLERRPDARVYGFDRDAEAIARAEKRFHAEIAAGRLTLIHSSFGELAVALERFGVRSVDGIMLDLGFSSYQVDDPARGFSFLKEGPLDMRLDRRRGPTAADIVNTWEHGELARIFREYGEERFAGKVASRIVDARRTRLFSTTTELAAAVSAALPPKSRYGQKIHPATRVFQALRIAVNAELEELERVLSLLPDILNPGGAIAIISFHSLEDRIVKQRFKYLSDDCVCPPPVMSCARCHKPPGYVESRRPLAADDVETAENPRARSAKLRIFVRGPRPARPA